MANHVIKNIISQHAEEASFNWLLRDAAVREPHYSLNDLAKLDKRVEAHLDGLRIAGDAGWEICKQELNWEEAGEVFTAAYLAFDSDDALRIHEVLEAGSAEPELCRGVISALGWLPFEQGAKYAKQFLSADSASLRYFGLAAHAIHRQDPGQALVEALRSEDTLLKARALKAVGELGRRDLAAYLQASFRDEDSKCRFYAAWSAALLGDAYACPILQTIAQADSPYREEATKMAF
ncbi:HEAT repeat domain-containing protein, partial [candidate division KSB1 bacterium]|nr:HEAT repeat domain-containing protein [candidate division KSB1 bacterium]